MKKIVVSGASGQLGSALRLLSQSYPEYDWFFADRTQLTLDNLSLLEMQLHAIQPDILINCAAYTAVDAAENEQEVANRVNHLAVAVLARYTQANRVLFVHISTDYVFDGSKSIPLAEGEPTGPINVYGASKLAGEKAAVWFNPNAVIIRTSWVYSEFGSNFVKTMLRLMQERTSINVVNDQIGSPTYAADLAQAILTIVKHPIGQPGIYHYANEGEISWYEFALAIKEIGGFDCQVGGIPASDYPTPAKRPAYSLLDKSKIKATFGVVVPEYKDSLRRCMGCYELKRIRKRMDSDTKILYKEESFKIIGACMKVHRSLGAGFLEAVYEEALEKEFLLQNIPFKRQLKLELYYENEKLKKQYRADFVCYGAIILELKAVSHIPDVFYAQLKNYLKCTKMELGMLINFGMSSLFYKRIVNIN